MPEVIKLPLDTPYLEADLGSGTLRRTLLPNGLRILTEEMPSARSATIGFWVGVGSRDEQGERQDAPASLGSTHFLEHLLFKGTPSRTAYDIAAYFDGIGAEHNALTAKEYTCYYAKVRDADVDEAVRALADMVTSSVLDPAEFESERGVILEELAMAADDLADVASEKLFAAVLGEKHPLGRPIGGSPADIRAAARDDVWEHYQRSYHPGSLVVAAAGAVNHAHLVEVLQEALDKAPAQWGSGTTNTLLRRVNGAAQPAAAIAADSVTPQVLVQKESEQLNLMLGCPGFALTDERRFTFGLFNAVLGTGMSSRLFQEIREKRGLAYTAYSFGASYSDAGLFGMYAGVSPVNARETVRLARAQLEEIAANGVSEDELQRAKGQIAGSATLALEDTDSRMGRLGRAELGAGELYPLDASLVRYAQVTVADVQALAAELAGRNFALVAVGATEAAQLAA